MAAISLDAAILADSLVDAPLTDTPVPLGASWTSASTFGLGDITVTPRPPRRMVPPPQPVLRQIPSIPYEPRLTVKVRQ